MQNRQAVDWQEWTWTIAGRSYSGWSETTTGEHRRAVGRYAQAGGDVVTKSRTITGAAHTFTKQYDRAEFARLVSDWTRNADEAAGIHHEVDGDGRPVATLGRMTGVLAARPKIADRRPNGDPMTMTITVEADGKIR